MKTIKLHPFEIEELACVITGLDYDEIDADNEKIEQALMDEFEISFDSFFEIISRLLPLIQVANSGLTNTTFKGFADIENFRWLTKTEA